MEFLRRLQHLQAVILDMDGVLVDTEPLHMEAFARFLDRLNLPYDNDYLFSFIGFSVPDNIRKIYHEQLQITDEQKIADGIRERDAIYLQLLRATPLKPLPGVTELVEFCQKKGLKLGLASSSDREQIETIFHNLSQTSNGQFVPQRLFQIVLSGEDVTHRKPDPEIYSKACQLLNVPPEHCLTIEDSPAGVTSALQAGLTVVALKSHFVPPENLKHAHLLVEEVKQLLPLLQQALS